MDITQTTFKAKVNNDFGVEVVIGLNPRGQESVTLKLVPSRQYAATRMTIPEFDAFLEDLRTMVHSNTKAGREAGNVTEATYTID